MPDRNGTLELARLLEAAGPVSATALTALRKVGTQVQLGRDDAVGAGNYVVLDGVVALQVQTTDGDTRITQFFESGDTMEVAAAAGVAMTDHRALNACRLFRIDRDDWSAALNTYPDLVLAVLVLKDRQMERLARRIASLMGESVRTRLAQYILRHLSEARETPGITRLPLRQYDLARYFGVQPETINRQFRALCDQGAIGLDGQTVELRDPALLTRAAMNQG